MKKILSILMIVVLLFTITGCSGSKPQDTVKFYLDSLKNGDAEEAVEYLKLEEDTIETPDEIISDEEDEDFNEAFKIAYSKLEYRILETEVNGDTAVVETEINAPDLGTIMTEVFKEVLPMALASAFDDSDDNYNDEEMDNLMNTMLLDKVNSDDMPMVKKKIKINLVKEGDKWLIEPDDKFFNAITGNLKAISELFEE